MINILFYWRGKFKFPGLYLLGEKNNNRGFPECRYFDQMIYTRSHLYSESKLTLIPVPCQETKMVAVQIPFVNTLQTKLQETYYTILKYKNEMMYLCQVSFS